MAKSFQETTRNSKLVIFASLTALLTYSCIYWAVKTVRYEREWDEAFAAEPANYVVDFSKTATIQGIFHHTYYRGHGVAFYFVPEENSEEVLAALGRIKGSFKLLNDQKEVIVKAEQLHYAAEMQLNDKMSAPRFAYFFSGIGQKGDYVAELTTNSSPEILKNKRIRVVAKYDLCGCEKMIELFTGGFAAFSGLAAVLFGLGAWLNRQASNNALKQETMPLVDS